MDIGQAGKEHYKELSHEMKSGTMHMVPLGISFIIQAVYDPLPSNANLVQWGMNMPTMPRQADHRIFFAVPAK
ncbi:hypothetical protein PoB_001554500 [Plakobranchus ocellatus]|uniref:Uncharacterized protein n=1 Tax=Plakobranchus ocellatus TaxID=259542 RepID=A0AAV3Z1L1_9GAST|nr:hypothetical protein PoB_001554500 [Plakobranchus ocellatus]